MQITDLIDKIEEIESIEEITNIVVNNFDDYPNIMSGFKSFINNQERYSLNKFKQQITNILNVVNNFSEEEFEALNIAIESTGPWDFEDTVESINRDDYIYFPGVESDYDLGKTYVDYIGDIKEAVGEEDLADYIDIREVAQDYYNNNEDKNLDLEDYIDIAREEVAENPEDFLDFFDFDAFGKDLRLIDGYFIGSTGAIWIQ